LRGRCHVAYRRHHGGFGLLQGRLRDRPDDPRAGLARPAIDALAAAGIETWIFDGVTADPPEAMVREAAAEAEARARGIDGVASVGGGSSLDTAKLIAVLARSEQPIADIYGVDLVRGVACRWCSRPLLPPPARR
jgi:alcohol dehydrogenase class IV